MLIALTESQLLYAVVGVYTTLVGLWFLYWLVERIWHRMGRTQGDLDPIGQRAIGIQWQEPSRLHSTPVRAEQPAPPSRTVAKPSPQRVEINRLRQELSAVREHSSVTESRLHILHVEVEALKFVLAEKLASLESGTTADSIDQHDAPDLSIYDPRLDRYDADWATVDSDLGVILHKRPVEADDLTRIWGVGQVDQERLNDIGVYCFQQIADWTDHHVAKFNELLSFNGRIEGEDWVGQAQQSIDQDTRHRAA